MKASDIKTNAAARTQKKINLLMKKILASLKWLAYVFDWIKNRYDDEEVVCKQDFINSRQENKLRLHNQVCHRTEKLKKI